MLRTTLLSLLAVPFLLFASPAEAQKPPRVIEVHARRFAFDPPSITVHHGETIRLRLISDDVPHSLLIKSLGINEAASKSHPGDILFTASQAGDFVGRCGRFCGSGHGNMHFVIHVTGD
jgi:cytochrome c oxidase subunit II